MSTRIYYNGVDIAGTQPVPLLGLSQEMITHGRGRHGQRSSITLDGQITGVYGQRGKATTHLDDVSNLALTFSENFKDLKVTEDGVDILTFSKCKVESINFSPGTLSQLTEYSISLSCYNNFVGTFGVLDPAEKVSFSEGEDGTISLTHDISAKGFSTNSSFNNAFSNAKNYVLGLTGWSPLASISPYFIGGGTNVYPVLLSTTESIDKNNATYGVTESYTFTAGATDYTPVIKYSVSKEVSLEDDVTTVTVEANARAGKNLTMDWTTFIGTLDLYLVATNWSETADLLSTPLDFSVDKDEFANTLVVKAIYDNNKLFAGGSVYVEPEMSFETDNMTDITTVSVKANFVSRGSWAQQKVNIEAFINALEARADGLIGYLHGEANVVYTSLYGTSFPLSKHSTSYGKDINDLTHEFAVSAAFNNKDFFPTTSPYSSTYNQASYTVSVEPSIRQYSPHPSYNQNGYYVIYDTNMQKRERVSFSLSTSYNTASAAQFGSPRDVSSRLNDNLEINLEGENALLEKLGSEWLLGGAILDTESSDVNEHTRTNSVNQTYTQIPSTRGTPQALLNNSYIPVNAPYSQ